MKANELQIGDFVFSPRGRVHKMHRVEFSNDDAWFESLTPIPLTPEILEKNGFYKDWDGKTYLMGKLFRLSPLIEGMGYCLNKWPSIQIYSVHTLQHILRLCGLNELADNFKI